MSVRADLTGSRSNPRAADRAAAALCGLALGDALGMPTQSMSRAAIHTDYGRITGFVDAGPRQRIAAGMRAGTITDDTEQALLLAQLLIEGHGVIDAQEFATRLLAWEQQMEARGSLDLLGPSTKSALERLQRGVPTDEAGRSGTTNGAAMRIAPVGIATDVSDLAGFIDAVASASALTHNTSLGIASAAAVGAAVSAGVGGASVPEAFEVSVAAATEGARRGYWAAGGSIAARLQWAVPYLRSQRSDQRERALYEVIGTSVAAQESVVAAIALAFVVDDPWDGLCTAATCGGDTDTVAAIAGAVLGATHDGLPWPPAQVTRVQELNNLDLVTVADDLLALRHHS